MRVIPETRATPVQTELEAPEVTAVTAPQRRVGRGVQGERAILPALRETRGIQAALPLFFVFLSREGRGAQEETPE